MIKNISQTRREYDACYRELRQGGGHFFREVTKQFDDVTADCAIISYDNHDSQFSGWINCQRMNDFVILRQAIVFREDFFRK